MNIDTLRFIIRREPFHAFEIHTRSGAVFRVADPAEIQIIPGTVTLLTEVPGIGRTATAVIDLAAVISLSFGDRVQEIP
jgi:hypothetical protein